MFGITGPEIYQKNPGGESASIRGVGGFGIGSTVSSLEANAVVIYPSDFLVGG